MAKIVGLYRCCNCGRVFEHSEMKVVEESRGEYWGIPCTERMYYSPCCTDDFENVYEEDELWLSGTEYEEV